MFGKKKKEKPEKDKGEKIEINKRELQRQLVEEERTFIEANLPQERKEITEIIRNLSNELMEYKQRVQVLQEELRSAVKRKKSARGALFGRYALVLFSLPKVKRGNESTKVRMHTVDNVKGNDVLTTIRRLMKDPDNEFVGAYTLLEMRGKKDAYERLRKNAEGAWHLFECLNGDLERYDPDKKQDKDDEEEDNPYAEEEEEEEVAAKE